MNIPHYTGIISLQVVIQTKVKKEQIFKIERVESPWLVEGLRTVEKLSQFVLSTDPPRERNCSVIIMEGRLEEIHWVTQDGDVRSIRRQELGYFLMVKAHVVANDVETGSGLVVLHLGALERRWVEEVIASVGEGKFKIVLFPESEEDVEYGATRSFMGLHEHEVHFGGALFWLGFGALSRCGHILLQ